MIVQSLQAAVAQTVAEMEAADRERRAEEAAAERDRERAAQEASIAAADLRMIVRARVAGRPELAEEIALAAEREALVRELAPPEPPHPTGDADAGRGNAPPVPDPGKPLWLLAAEARADAGDEGFSARPYIDDKED